MKSIVAKVVVIMIISVVIIAQSEPCYSENSDNLGQWIGTWKDPTDNHIISISEFEGELIVSGNNSRNIKLSSDGKSLKYDADYVTRRDDVEVNREMMTVILRMQREGVFTYTNTRSTSSTYYKQ